MPERFLPGPSVQGCVLGQTWKQLRALLCVVSTGGLGREMVVSEFEVWVCMRDSSGGGATGAVCSTCSEAFQVFVPWGFEGDLDFVRARR